MKMSKTEMAVMEFKRQLKQKDKSNTKEAIRAIKKMIKENYCKVKITKDKLMITDDMDTSGRIGTTRPKVMLEVRRSKK